MDQAVAGYKVESCGPRPPDDKPPGSDLSCEPSPLQPLRYTRGPPVSRILLTRTAHGQRTASASSFGEYRRTRTGATLQTPKGPSLLHLVRVPLIRSESPAIIEASRQRNSRSPLRPLFAHRALSDPSSSARHVSPGRRRASRPLPLPGAPPAKPKPRDDGVP